MRTFYLSAGSNRPKLSAIISGPEMDLTGATVTLRVYNPDGSIKFSVNCTGPGGVSLDSTNEIEAGWNADNIWPPGRYRIDARIVSGDAEQTVPNVGDDACWLVIT